MTGESYYYLRTDFPIPVARTVELTDSILVDMAADGDPIGVEFLAPFSDLVLDVSRLLGRLVKVEAGDPA